MDIKIITCHDVYNYGASLQAYALMHFLQQGGHRVSVIDYLPAWKRRKYDFCLEKTGVFGRLALVFPLLKPLFAQLRYRSLWKFRGRKKAFDAFKQEHLSVTDRCYTSLEDFREYPLKADLFIAGSDQIWNPNYGNGLDSVYYCGFAGFGSRCISYAASFGVESLSAQSYSIMKPLLRNFAALSIRERTGVDLANTMGYEATNVCDPVFLLSVKDWDSLCRRHVSGSYLLVYDFKNDNPQLRECAMRVAKARKLKIISINDEITIPYADRNVNNAGPIEFVEYIRNADFVVASSFHAIAFSVIFQKDFLSFPLLGHGNSSRMMDFLTKIGLEDRFMPKQFDACQPINFQDVNKKLKPFIDASEEWLLTHIQGK